MARNLIDMLNRVGLGLAIAGVTGLGIFIGEYPARNYLNKKHKNVDSYSIEKAKQEKTNSQTISLDSNKSSEPIQIAQEQSVNHKPKIEKEKIYNPSIKFKETIKLEPLAIYSHKEMIPSIEEWHQRDYRKPGWLFGEKEKIADNNLKLKVQYWQKIELMKRDPKQTLERLTKKESQWLENFLSKKIEDVPNLQNLEFQFPDIDWESKIVEIYFGENKSWDLSDKVRIFNLDYFYETAGDKPSFIGILADQSSRTILKKPLYACCEIEGKRIAFKIGKFELYNKSDFFTEFDTETYDFAWDIPLTEKGIIISHEEAKRRVKKFVAENKMRLITLLITPFSTKVEKRINDKYKELIDIDYFTSLVVDKDNYMNKVITTRKSGIRIPPPESPDSVKKLQEELRNLVR